MATTGTVSSPSDREMAADDAVDLHHRFRGPVSVGRKMGLVIISVSGVVQPPRHRGGSLGIRDVLFATFRLSMQLVTLRGWRKAWP